MTLVDLIFYAVAAITVACAGYAVFSGNIVRAVFSLLGTFFGVAVLYGMLSADFVAVVQIMVYVGGILVLMLFAVMLTGNIQEAKGSSPSGSLAMGALMGGIILVVLVSLALKAPWHTAPPSDYAPTTANLGHALLGPALLLFEMLGVLLLGVVIGAVVIARRGSGKGTGPGSIKG